MKIPKLVQGNLYILRDRDFRTGVWGPYVKLGIVHNERESEKRNKEHQTGNPRQIVLQHNIFAPMVDSLETQLHHRFSELRVHGEWFEMSETFVVEQVLPEVNRIVQQQEACIAHFRRQTQLKTTASTGTVRPPTAEEHHAWEEWKSAREAFVLADSRKKLLSYQLRQATQGSHTIPGIVRLLPKTGKPTLDQAAFKENHPELYQKFLKERPDKIAGTMRLKGAATLKALDADLHAKLKTAKDGLPTFTPASLVEEEIEPVEELRMLHQQFLSSHSAFSQAEWGLQLCTARLASLLGTDDAITGLVEWKRSRQSQDPALDTNALKVAHPELYAQFTIPGKQTLAVDIAFYRAYPLDPPTS